MGLPGRPVDDGQALLYLFGRPDVEVLGITTVFGNSAIERVHPATAALLADIGRELPLRRGAGAAGEADTEAAAFLVETAAAHPGEITLLAVGPLTNVKAAADADPAFFDHLDQIVIMGGYLAPLALPGWEGVGELNLSVDAEAAHQVLRAACPVTLMTAQVCLDAPFSLRALAVIEQYDRTKTYAMLRDYLLRRVRNERAPSEYLWDLLPAVYVSYPELFDENPTWIRSTVSDLTSGSIICAEEDEGTVVNMPTQIADVDQFYAILHDAWAREVLTRT
jgi:inosine-uridine nucleoside N-ribohydrolase